MAFKKVERCYYTTPNGWRLTTFEEAKNGLNIIKEQNILNNWDRVRLLDGWITGPSYNFEMGQDFKGCLGYMLLIQTQASGFAYADVNLSDSGKEVALFLCVDDWNFEVVYWLLNCWSKSETMNLADVRGGNIPLINAATFKEMNESIGHVARRLGHEAGAAREKAGNIKYSGVDSVKDVLSGILKCIAEEEEIVQCIGRVWQFTYEAEEYCLPESVKPEYVEVAFWNFVCDSFAGYVVETCALESLLQICMMTEISSRNNFMIAIRILLYLSDFRLNIIHEPMAHNCTGSCAAKILSYAAKDGDPEVFNEMLQKNGMWRFYEETGNYSILHKLLTVVAKGKKYKGINNREKVDGDIIEMLLRCGAQPERRYAIGKCRSKTTLQFIAKFGNENVGIKIAEALLRRCGKQSVYDLVIAADDRGRTALHRASEKGNARICQLLLDWGASLTAQDKNKRTALHYAVEGGKDKVTGVLLGSPLVTEALGLKDSSGRTALDIAVTNMDYESTAKLLSSTTEEPEAYLRKVDKPEQLLRYCILHGSVNIFSLLSREGKRLPPGDSEHNGRTAFHLAAMCDDEDRAIEMTSFIVNAAEDGENVEKMLSKQDKSGRTALHEAALKGHKRLCVRLLELNSELIYVKDRHGQNPLYDAVRGEFNGTNMFELLQASYLKKARPEDDLVARGGLTPLHVAASEGKASHIKQLLSSNRMKDKYLSRGDMVGQTALHKAAKRGDIETVEILLKNGAHPLRERDCDDRTALHYAVLADTEDKIKLIEALLKRCTKEEKSLLLWASAAGLGTADQTLSNTDPLYKFLVHKMEKIKHNLLRTAASLGDIKMVKELCRRGYQIGAIRDQVWRSRLSKQEAGNVKKVLRQIDMIMENVDKEPSTADSVGVLDYAKGLAALFLNPYLNSSIAVGITGSWSMRKPVVLQTERVLLATAAHIALLQSTKLSSSALQLPGMKASELSKMGKRKCEYIYKYITYGQRVKRNIFVTLWNNLKSKPFKPSTYEIQKELENFVNRAELLEHRRIFKAIAAMDSSDMWGEQMWGIEPDIFSDEDLPAIITVQYNTLKYKNETEALAGLALEITGEFEGLMTPAQWLSSCWRYNWKRDKNAMLIEIFIPCLLGLVLASFFTWIAWQVLGSEMFRKWGKAKYAWLPAGAVTIVIILWTLTKKITGVLKPISSQLRRYTFAPDHTDKLGYREKVISDIIFLKAEIGEKPFWVFIVFAWICSTFSVLSHQRRDGEVREGPKFDFALRGDPRIIVFVSNLDNCDEFAILEVLSALNFVLRMGQISVVLEMGKKLTARAFLKKHGDQNTGTSLITNHESTEMYLQKVIQLPLDLPDPRDEERKRFLRRQLGSLQQNEAKESMKDDRISSSDEEEGEATQVEITVSEMDDRISSRIEGEGRETVQAGRDEMLFVQKIPIPIPLLREMMYISYSEGEQDAFLFFESFITGCRKHPHEWTRFLIYHRLVWNIFSSTKEASKLTGWRVQLITWIFVCWEWQENMNIVIEKWKEIDLKSSEPNGASLLMIVVQLMEEQQTQIVEMIVSRNGGAEGGHERKEKSSEVEESVAKINNSAVATSSSNEAEDLHGNGENRKKLEALEKLISELKEEMKELKELMSYEMKKDIKELQNQVSGEIKRDINEIKRRMTKQHNGEEEEIVEHGKNKLDNWANWKRMKSALERYDVPMDAIQVFQRFRFY